MRNKLSRRQFLCTAIGAITTAAVMPTCAFPKPIETPKPYWFVGTNGEEDWQCIRAATSREAKLSWLDQSGDYYGIRAVDDHDDDDPTCDCMKCKPHDAANAACKCSECCAITNIDTISAPQLDGVEDVKPRHWAEAGMGYPCRDCDACTYTEDCAYVVGDDVVCGECMKISDWDIVDPVRAAELREEKGLS